MSIIDNMAHENKNLDNLLGNLNVSSAESPEPANQNASDDEPFVDPLILECHSFPDPSDFNNKKTQTDQKPNPCADHAVEVEDREDFVLQTKVSNNEEVIRIKGLIEVQNDVVFNLVDVCENIDIQKAADDLQPAFRKTSIELIAFCEFAQIQYGALYREVDELDIDTHHPEKILEFSGQLAAFRKQFEQINKALKEKFGANQLFRETFEEVGDYLEETRFWGTEDATSYNVDPLEFLKPETDHDQN